MMRLGLRGRAVSSRTPRRPTSVTPSSNSFSVRVLFSTNTAAASLDRRRSAATMIRGEPRLAKPAPWQAPGKVNPGQVCQTHVLERGPGYVCFVLIRATRYNVSTITAGTFPCAASIPESLPAPPDGWRGHDISSGWNRPDSPSSSSLRGSLSRAGAWASPSRRT